MGQLDWKKDGFAGKEQSANLPLCQSYQTERERWRRGCEWETGFFSSATLIATFKVNCRSVSKHAKVCKERKSFFTANQISRQKVDVFSCFVCSFFLDFGQILKIHQQCGDGPKSNQWNELPKRFSSKTRIVSEHVYSTFGSKYKKEGQGKNHNISLSGINQLT